MPSLMAKRSSSERCAIRRELHRRRKLAAAPKGGIVKKSSTAASIQEKTSADEPAGPGTTKPSSMTIPMPRPRAGVAMSPAAIMQHAPAAVATKKQPAAVDKGAGGVAKEIADVRIGQVAKRCTAPPRRSAFVPTASSMKVSAVKRVAGVPNKSVSPCRPASIAPASSGADTTELSVTTGAESIKNMPTIPPPSRSSSIRVKKGMTVKVRTRAGILPTGHCLVLWLAARVVSDAAADDGFLDVMYNGNFPRDDPLRTVRVAMGDVRSMPAIPES